MNEPAAESEPVKTPPTQTFAIIDGKSIFYRGYYAMPNLSTKDGTPTGGVYGFAAVSLEILKQLKPNFVAVAWDKAKTNIRRRRAIYAGYKANRHPAPPDFYAQIPILRELLDALGWPLYELDDFEADDIIGTLAAQGEKLGIVSQIISSDLDMLQLVDADTQLYAVKRGFTDIRKFDVAALEQKYGIKKDQFLDLKALKGDASDNIPGVPGVGEKTAVALLNQFETLDGIYDNLDKIKPAWRVKLEAGRDSAYMSKALGKIDCGAPLKFDRKASDIRNLDVEKLRDELQKLEFNSLIRRLPDFMKSSGAPDFNDEDAADAPGIFYESDGGIIVNDGLAKAENDLRAGRQLKPILFDCHQAGFLLDQRTPKISSVKNLREIYAAQKARLAQNPRLDKLARQVDFPLQNLLAEIEARGVRLDAEKLSKMSDELSEQIVELTRQIHQQAGEDFNVGSPVQLSKILFEKLKLPTAGIKKSARGGWSTGRKELAKLRPLHPIIALIENVRELLKLKNTYVDALPAQVDARGYLHTSFRQDVTATGRLSSSGPNLQNIPARTVLGQKIRECFIASPGKILVNVDYSQFELRLAAALAGDENLIKDFSDPTVDIHTKTAADVYGVDPADVSPIQRRHAKVINFGVLYGMSPHGLSEATGMSFADAKTFIQKYFQLRAPIRDFLDKTIKQAREQGFVETLFGRRRLTPDVKSGNFMIRASAERAAANMPIQGTEADIVKMAMLQIDRELKNVAPQIMQVHDSIMVECDPAAAAEIGAKMKNIMENIYPELGVVLRADVKIGGSWGDV